MFNTMGNLDKFRLRDSALKNYYPHVIAQFRRRLAVYRDNAIVRQSFLLDPRQEITLTICFSSVEKYFRFLHMSLLDPNVRAQDLEDIFREADNGFADQGESLMTIDIVLFPVEH